MSAGEVPRTGTPAERQGQVVRDLAARRDDDPVRGLQFDDVHHPLETQFVEIQAVAEVVVGRDRFRVVIHHDAPETVLPEGLEGLHPAPVELHGGADPVGARAEDDHRTAVPLEGDVVLRAAIGQIEVARRRGILGRKGVDLLDRRDEADGLAPGPDGGLRRPVLEGTGDLGVGETEPFHFAEQLVRNSLERTARLQFRIQADQVLQPVEEPAVDLRKGVDPVHGIAFPEGLLNRKQPVFRRFREGFVQVFDIGDGIVAGEAGEALPDHPDAFLDGLLEGPADGHYLAHRLHARADVVVHPVELAEIPAGQLADDVVEGRLEERARRTGHAVFQLEEPVAQRQLGGDEGERIARRLGGEGGGAAQPRIDLDDAVIVGIRVQGILDVAFAHDAQVRHDLEAQRAEFLVLAVGKGLGRGDDHALPRMDAERVEILHVADGDPVAVAVADGLIFNFFPSLQALFDEHLRGEGKGLFGELDELLSVVAEAGAETAEGIGRADDHGVADLLRRSRRFPDGGAGRAPDGLDPDLVQLLHEELAVLRGDDGLDRRAEDPDAVLFQDAGPVQGDAAVERRLAAEREQDAVRPLLLDDLLDEIRGNRQEIHLVRDTLARLDGGDVRVHKHGRDPLLPQGLEGLRPGVVEFSRLPDFQGAGAEQQHFGRTFGHGFRSLANWSKRKTVSRGPPAASGWNWALNQGFSRWRMPSLEPSLRLVNSGSQPEGSVLSSTA